MPAATVCWCEVTAAFRGAFLAMAAFTTGGLLMAWWLPVRLI